MTAKGDSNNHHPKIKKFTAGYFSASNDFTAVNEKEITDQLTLHIKQIKKIVFCICILVINCSLDSLKANTLPMLHIPYTCAVTTKPMNRDSNYYITIFQKKVFGHKYFDNQHIYHTFLY